METLGEFILKSYLPLELEEGMLFINRISVGVIEPYIELWELDFIPENIDEFISKHGAPITLLIINEKQEVIATEEEIGWWDEGEHTDELRDITLDDINIILRDYDGYVNVEVDDEIILYENKVVLSFSQSYHDY